MAIGHYLEKSLRGDEKLIYSADLHWIVYSSGIIFTAIGALLGHYGHVLSNKFLEKDLVKMLDKPISYLSIGIIVLGALYLLVGFIRQISTELAITNQRVIAKFGLISVTTHELMLNKVEGANIDQTIAGRLLGYGTVMVRGTGGGISPIDHVSKPYKFHSHLMNVLEKINKQQ